jgi:hypothetical protein
MSQMQQQRYPGHRVPTISASITANQKPTNNARFMSDMVEMFFVTIMYQTTDCYFNVRQLIEIRTPSLNVCKSIPMTCPQKYKSLGKYSCRGRARNTNTLREIRVLILLSS